MLVDVFLRKTAEKDAVETGVESIQVGATHVTDTRLGLERNMGGEKGDLGWTTGEGNREQNRRGQSVWYEKSSAVGQSPEP